MVLSIIFLENKHKMLLHLSIFYEYQPFFQHRICFSIQSPDYSDPWPTLARSTSFFLIMLFNYYIPWPVLPSLTKTLIFVNQINELNRFPHMGQSCSSNTCYCLTLNGRMIFIKVYSINNNTIFVYEYNSLNCFLFI